MHAEDSVFENHTTGDVNIGREAIGSAIRGIFTVFPDLETPTVPAYRRLCSRPGSSLLLPE